MTLTWYSLSTGPVNQSVLNERQLLKVTQAEQVVFIPGDGLQLFQEDGVRVEVAHPHSKHPNPQLVQSRRHVRHFLVETGTICHKDHYIPGS